MAMLTEGRVVYVYCAHALLEQNLSVVMVTLDHLVVFTTKAAPLVAFSRVDRVGMGGVAFWIERARRLVRVANRHGDESARRLREICVRRRDSRGLKKAFAIASDLDFNYAGLCIVRPKCRAMRPNANST